MGPERVVEGEGATRLRVARVLYGDGVRAHGYHTAASCISFPLEMNTIVQRPFNIHPLSIAVTTKQQDAINALYIQA